MNKSRGNSTRVAWLLAGALVAFMFVLAACGGDDDDDGDGGGEALTEVGEGEGEVNLVAARST
jgi:hypothetical protein